MGFLTIWTAQQRDDFYDHLNFWMFSFYQLSKDRIHLFNFTHTHTNTHTQTHTITHSHRALLLSRGLIDEVLNAGGGGRGPADAEASS